MIKPLKVANVRAQSMPRLSQAVNPSSGIWRRYGSQLADTEQNCSGARFHVDALNGALQFPIRGIE
jgi:hypothetical protein